MIKGTTVSPGVAQGTAYVLADDDSSVPAAVVPPEKVPEERRRLSAALSEAEGQLSALQKKVAEKIGERQAAIFAAQILALKDPGFMSQMLQLIEDQRLNVESALSQVVGKYARAFAEIQDPYFRERAADVRDMGRRVLSLLLKGPQPEAVSFPDDAIVVAGELLPSALARMDFHKIRGIATERGGRTSHTAILARSLGVPAVTGLKDALKRVKNGDRLLLDGAAGVVFVNPKKSVSREYDKLEAEFKAYREELRHFVDLPSVTQDGVPVVLAANIGKQADADAALLYKADGVGLYRTEFQFAVQSEFPSEDVQFEIARRIAEKFHPRRVAFRILDLGGDKDLPYFPVPRGANPALGLRGVRLLLRNQEILRPQLRALLRASAEFPLRILVPMVGAVEEISAVRKIMEAEAKALGLKPKAELGAMIETPAAVLLAAELAAETDFLSLGTNDLVQYMLAADRDEEAMGVYYEPLHPAVLRAIQALSRTAKARGKELSICGAMAGDPFYSELLVGLGLRSFSVSPGEIPQVKRAIRSVAIPRAESLARAAVDCATVARVEEKLKEFQATPLTNK